VRRAHGLQVGLLQRERGFGGKSWQTIKDLLLVLKTKMNMG
jgi:hypothetical protein